MKKVYLSLSLLLSFSVFAQQNNKTPYTPNVHAPEVSNLGKYLDYPVDISTGVPKIEVPLYEVISGKLKLPISLSYHASGIKVNQEESNVGLGWNLNAGGSIIRNIKDVPDDYSSFGFLFTGGSIPVVNDIADFQGPVGTTGNNDLLKSYYGFLNYSPLHRDTQTDSYTINTNAGISGEFYINNNLQFVSAEIDPININANLPLNTIELKDESGNIYRFGKSLQNENAYDKITSSYTPDPSDDPNANPGLNMPSNYLPYNSAWHLTEIISADGLDVIQIKYRKNSDYGIASLIEKRSYTYTQGIMSPQSERKNGAYHQISSEYTIDKIISKDAVIKFDYAYDRQDRPTNPDASINIPRISGLTIYDKNNVAIKKIILENNSYFDRFSSSLYYNHYLQPLPSFFLKSLKLSGVKFLDKNDNLINKYHFDYDSTQLPTKNSASIDFWGYYNGKNNTTLLPTLASDLVYTPESMNYDSRETNFNYMKAGILTKITYPTGGSTSYEYEPNYFLTSKQEQGLGIYDKSFTYYALKSNANCTEGQELISQPQIIKEFIVTEDIANVVINFGVFFSDFYPQNVGGNFIAPKAIVKVDGWQKIITHGPTGSNTPKTESFSFPVHKGSVIRIELYTNNAFPPSMSSPCNSPFISVQGNYKYYASVPTQQIEPKQAGGLRVKSILSYDNNNSLVLRKAYEYGSKKSGSNSIGIGKIISNPYELENYYKSLELEAINKLTGICAGYEHKEKVWLNTNPLVELGYNNGAPVYYDKVTEYVEDQNNIGNSLGKTEYFYSSQGVDFLPSANYYKTYNTFIYPKWKKGNLLKKIDYKKENIQFLPTYSEENKYIDLIENRIRNFNIFEKDSEYQSPVCAQGQVSGYLDNNPNRFLYFNDYVSVGKRVLDTKTIKQYLYNNGNVAEPTTVIRYEYANPSHYQLTKEIVTSPDDIISETSYNYAYEKNNQKLIDAHIIGIPLETIVRKKQNLTDTGKIISKNETRYDNPANLFPSSVLSYDIQSNNSITEATFDKYDTKGNLIQYTTKDGVSTAIIWGYNLTQPIAKIEGAKLTDIQQSLIDSIVNASNTDASIAANNDETSLLSVLNTFRNSLPNFQITTYTYDPLIGVRSITPPSGIRESYVYDSANRLEKVIDVNGKVLKEMKYNYKN
ncbi:hypothetical protein [Chryseobacterium viscerum]|uniref:hypothetical protein n=1 Tax=Chryseobacterium viscerum TaxID=1037377 RepID=UPI0022235C94|nr:hypothetical protein [Chryseobacterium viscerum]MCW1961547.1 hypothetical protein [Chryseobacterium viscerum]